MLGLEFLVHPNLFVHSFLDFCNLVHANNSQLFTRLVWLKGHQMSDD